MKIALIGRTEILYETAELLIKSGYNIELIITAKEAPEYKKAEKDFLDFAAQHNILCISSSKIQEEHRKTIKELNIDIGISINYVTKISQDVIDLFPYGILNAHGGDLPRYKGNACQAWAILNKESKIGLCIHKMTGENIDSGDIICREYLDIDINTKVTKCWEWMLKLVPTLFLEAINKLEDNCNYVLEVQSTNQKESLRCYPRVIEDGKIDWNKSNEDILRLINASNKPYAGAYFYYDNKKVIIWDAELFFDEEVYLSEVGQVCTIQADGTVIIITGSGKLKINIVECEDFVGSPKKILKSIRMRCT